MEHGLIGRGRRNRRIMQTHELLDRYELLYPEVSAIADLRRAFIDQDLSSIFRLCDENQELRKAVIEENLHSIFRVLESKSCYEVDDLYKYMEDVRKAVVNKNLRSIFKLLGDDNLRKLIIDENVYKLWPILNSYVDTQFTSAFKSFFINRTAFASDCFSRGQLQSKLWLVDELKKCNVDLGTVFLCAGWYATLATMLFESDIKVDKIRSFDLDPSCIDIAETFNKPWFMETWRFKSITQDIMDIDYDTHKWQSWSNANNRMSRYITDSPNTIINTSCEHIENFPDWWEKIPAGKLVVLQSNNFFEVDEHVNCDRSLEEFSGQTPLNSVLYSDSLQLEKYTRYMRIGYK
jgi:hypothetical protein